MSIQLVPNGRQRMSRLIRERDIECLLLYGHALCAHATAEAGCPGDFCAYGGAAIWAYGMYTRQFNGEPLPPYDSITTDVDMHIWVADAEAAEHMQDILLRLAASDEHLHMLQPLASMLGNAGATAPQGDTSDGGRSYTFGWVQDVIAPEVAAYQHGHKGFRFSLGTVMPAHFGEAPETHTLLDVSVNTTPFEAFDVLVAGHPLRLRSMGIELFNQIKLGSMCLDVAPPAAEKARQRRARTAYLLTAMRSECGDATFGRCMPASATTGRDPQMVRFYDQYAVLKHFRGAYGALSGLATDVRSECEGRAQPRSAATWAIGAALLRQPPPARVLSVQLRQAPYTRAGHVAFDPARWGGVLRILPAGVSRPVPMSSEADFVGAIDEFAAALDGTFNPAQYELMLAELP